MHTPRRTEDIRSQEPVSEAGDSIQGTLPALTDRKTDRFAAQTASQPDASLFMQASQNKDRLMIIHYVFEFPLRVQGYMFSPN